MISHKLKSEDEYSVRWNGNGDNILIDISPLGGWEARGVFTEKEVSELIEKLKLLLQNKPKKKKGYKGRINVYKCPIGHTTITIDKDDGVTPFMIGCRADKCDEMANSCFYQVEQDLKPTYEWYSPDEEERNKIKETDLGTFEHVAKGGLLLREIK